MPELPVTYTTVYPNDLTTADGAPPEKKDGECGWYYKNDSPNDPNKINWYVRPTETTTVAQFRGVYLNVKIIGSGIPYIAVYTKPPIPPNSQSQWYTSRRVYAYTESVNPGYYTLLLNNSETPPTPPTQTPEHTLLNLTQVDNKNVGDFGTTETIMFYAISTNSAATVDTVEILVQNSGLITSTKIEHTNFEYEQTLRDAITVSLDDFLMYPNVIQESEIQEPTTNIVFYAKKGIMNQHKDDNSKNFLYDQSYKPTNGIVTKKITDLSGFFDYMPVKTGCFNKSLDSVGIDIVKRSEHNGVGDTLQWACSFDNINEIYQSNYNMSRRVFNEKFTCKQVSDQFKANCCNFTKYVAGDRATFNHKVYYLQKQSDCELVLCNKVYTATILVLDDPPVNLVNNYQSYPNLDDNQSELGGGSTFDPEATDVTPDVITASTDADYDWQIGDADILTK